MVRSSFSYPLLLLFFFSLALCSHSTKTVKIEDICNQMVDNKTFCFSFLNSKPGGAAGADLLSLGLYSAAATKTNLTNSIILIKALLKTTKEHDLRALYSDCKEQYEDLAEDVESAMGCLKAGTCYGSVNRLAGDVADAADDCAGNGDIPLPDGNPLKQNSIVLGYVSEVLMIIANLLKQN